MNATPKLRVIKGRYMYLNSEIIIGLSVPFIGTALGSAVVFFMRRHRSDVARHALTGFAAGVMAAASIWSLILPAIEQSADMGAWSFLPALLGFWAGNLFLMLLGRIVPRLYRTAEQHSGSQRTFMTALAVTIHNIPEGMAVGVVYAGLVTGIGDISASGALALATGIAIQNFPEGAIISMPLCAQGYGKPRAFLYGALSGAVEPLFGLLTVLSAGFITPAMPFLLSFAAGTMFYVVVDELIPEAAQGKPSPIGVLMFAAGFTVMMSLDVALG